MPPPDHRGPGLQRRLPHQRDLPALNGTYTNLYRAQMQRSAVSARLLQEVLVTSYELVMA